MLSTGVQQRFNIRGLRGSYHCSGGDKKKSKKRSNKHDSSGDTCSDHKRDTCPKERAHRHWVVMKRKSPLPSRGLERGAPLVCSEGQRLEQREQHVTAAGEAREAGGSDGSLDCSARHVPFVVGKTLRPSSSPLPR